MSGSAVADLIAPDVRSVLSRDLSSERAGRTETLLAQAGYRACSCHARHVSSVVTEVVVVPALFVEPHPLRVSPSPCRSPHPSFKNNNREVENSSSPSLFPDLISSLFESSNSIRSAQISRPSRLRFLGFAISHAPPLLIPCARCRDGSSAACPSPRSVLLWALELRHRQIIERS